MHQDNEAIGRLKNNQPLTAADVQLLEESLWGELGTKEEYEIGVEESGGGDNNMDCGCLGEVCGGKVK